MSEVQELAERIAERAGYTVAEYLYDRLRKGGVIVFPEYMDPRQAASFCAISPKTLEAKRHDGTGPKHSKVGHLVRYKVQDLRDWMTSLEVAK